MNFIKLYLKVLKNISNFTNIIIQLFKYKYFNEVMKLVSSSIYSVLQ